jgi:two-component system sensor histidine kinase KdpD
VRETFFNRIIQFAAAFAIVVAIVYFYRRILPVNATTVALTLLLAILAVSTIWGMAVSVFMSVIAKLAFN